MAKRTLPRLLQTPAVVLLLIWMLVPLSMTLYFSFIRYVLVNFRRPEWATPSLSNWRGFGNYKYVLEAKDFWMAIQNSVLIVSSILVLTVILGLDCGSHQPNISGTWHCSSAIDFPIFRHAGSECGFVDQHDPRPSFRLKWPCCFWSE